MYNQHVLRLERLFGPRATFPSTHKGFLVGVDVIVVDMLINKLISVSFLSVYRAYFNKVVLSGKFGCAVLPMAVGFYEVAGLVLEVARVSWPFG